MKATDQDLQLGKWLGSAAVGALVMYMLDPERGAPRRAQSGQKLRELGRQTGDMLDKMAQGMDQYHGSSSSSNSNSNSNSSSNSSNSNSSNSSSSPNAGADRGHFRERRSWLQSRPWSPGERGAALLGGSGLGLYSMMGRHNPTALLLGLAGIALLTRGATNRSLRGMVGIGSSGARRVTIEKSILVDASPEQVYDLWLNYENFPRFMANVTEVRDLGERRSHWVMKGPAGSSFSWDAILTEQDRPHRLAWESAPGAEVEQNGTVQIEPARGGTLATVRISYRPPAGAIGQTVATLFGKDPQRELNEDLERMKTLAEGGALQRGGRPSSSSSSSSEHRSLH